MSSRLVNALLAVAVVLAFATGWISFSAGTGWGRIPVVVHGVAGLALLVLSAPKSPIMQRGWRRRRPGRVIEFSLTFLAIVTVVSGIVQAGGWLPTVGPFNQMQIHVTSGVVLTVLTVWHLRRRPAPRPFDPARRAAVQSAGIAALATGTWFLTEALIRATGTERRFTGSHEVGSFDPGRLPVTMWINDRPPMPFNEVVVAGQPLSVDELDTRAEPVVALLDCTTGWYSEQEWHGVPLSALVGSGRTIEVRSATGYRRRFPTRDSPHLYLATRLGGAPLTAGHGAPVRLVAPGRRGFWWVKWVTEVTVDDRPWWAQFPFPLT